MNAETQKNDVNSVRWRLLDQILALNFFSFILFIAFIPSTCVKKIQSSPSQQGKHFYWNLNFALVHLRQILSVFTNLGCLILYFSNLKSILLIFHSTNLTIGQVVKLNSVCFHPVVYVMYAKRKSACLSYLWPNTPYSQRKVYKI